MAQASATTDGTIAIVGAGQCGGRAAITLRELGWAGRIMLFGEETQPPYERPALSKGVLTGEIDPGRLTFLPRERLAELGIEFHGGAGVARLSPRAGQLHLRDGRIFGFDRALIATGAVPKRLGVPGSALAGVHTLRTAEDAVLLRRALVAGRNLVVVGAGLVGLEVAASARWLGVPVTVLEAGSRAMARVVPDAIAARVCERHRAAGVEIVFNAQIAELVGASRVEAVRLADGKVLAADTVVVAIGVVPNTALGEASGLEVDDGIVVDEELRTSAENVYAAGDTCRFRLSGARLRLENWQNAEDQGRIAAANLLGGHERSEAVPSFWSDQFDLGIRGVGLIAGSTRSVRRERADSGLIVFEQAENGRLVAASGVASAYTIGRDIKLARIMIERGRAVDAASLANPAVGLRDMLAKRQTA